MQTEHQWSEGQVTFEAEHLTQVPPEIAALLMSYPIPRKFFEYFFADGSVDVLIGPADLELVRFGYGRSTTPIGLNARTHEVNMVMGNNPAEISLVNSSLDKFLDFMALAEGEYPYYTDEADLETTGDFSDKLYAQLEKLDPPAFSGWSYWSTFVSDVGNGDYAEIVDED
jgi:SUKH-4 immunity protein